MANTFTREHVLALHAVTPAANGPFTLPSGLKIPLRGLTTVEYLQQVVRQVESFADSFIAPLHAFGRLTDEQRASVSTVAKDGTVDVDEEAFSALMLREVPLDDMLKRSVLDQYKVDAATVAACMDFGGDAEVIASVEGWPDEDFDAAVVEAEFRTWGADSGPFLDGVRAKAIRLKVPTRPSPSTNSRPSPRKTTSSSRAKARRTRRAA